MKPNIKLLKARLITDKKADKKVILSALMIQKKFLQIYDIFLKIFNIISIKFMVFHIYICYFCNIIKVCNYGKKH